jgi:hypothetical protein
VRASSERELVPTHNLLHDLAGRVEVDQALVDLELITVPGLRTLTARLPVMSVST